MSKKQNRFISVCLLLFISIFYLTSGVSARVRKITPANEVETIKFLSANHIPVKVIVVYNPDTKNDSFVAALINIVAEMHEKGKLGKEEAFKVHLIPSKTAKENDCADLRKLVSTERMKKYVEINREFATNDVWMQDWGEVAMVGLKNTPKQQLAVFDSNRGRGNAALPGLLADFWNSYLIKNPSNEFSGGDYGGNIEVTPDNVLLIGNTSTPVLRAFLEMRGYEGRMAVLDTDWLFVGHVDEYISVCPNPKAKRGYALIRANPRLALKLIKDTPIAELEKITIENYRQELINVHKYLFKAKAARARSARSGRARKGREQVSFAEAVLRYLDGSTDVSGHGQVNFSLDIKNTDSEDQSELAAEEFIRLNLTIAQLIDGNIKKACDTITQVRKDNNKFHSVLSFPALFHKIRYGKHVAYIPGSVNQLILHDQMIVPDPQIESFRGNIARTASMIGMHANFVDSLPYHNAQGQIHCGTNVFRHPNRFFVKPK